MRGGFLRKLLGCLLLLAAMPLCAQTPPPKPAIPEKSSCADCGVVRSVRTLAREMRPPPQTENKPSGLVASVPLGSGGGKPQIGSSTRVGKDVAPVSETWEVTIRLDDGRFRVIVLDEPPEVREGDKVRVEPNGQIKLRTD